MPSKNHNFQSYRPDSSSGLPVLPELSDHTGIPGDQFFQLRKVSARLHLTDLSCCLTDLCECFIQQLAGMIQVPLLICVRSAEAENGQDHRLRPHLHPADPSDCPGCTSVSPMDLESLPKLFFTFFAVVGLRICKTVRTFFYQFVGPAALYLWIAVPDASVREDVPCSVN